jgi:uncharacterized protein (UPF0332 family)
MSNAAMASLERGREEVRAAQVLLDAGYPSQAVSRACTAALDAANAALLVNDESPSTSAGVVAAFARRVVTDDSLDPDHARALRRLFEDRNDVDHALAQAPPGEAEDAITTARLLVAAAGRAIEASVQRAG